jgi:hypothetical protein
MGAWQQIKTLSTLALATVAVFAAVPAVSTASNFTASSYPATFSGTSSGQVFVLEAGKVECGTTKFSGTLTASSSSVTIEASYSSCKAFGFVSATVNMNGCDYVFSTFGKWDINCGASPITISTSTCEATINSQSGLAPLSIANGSGGLWLGPETKSLVYTVTKDGIGCPFSGTGAKTGGNYASVVDLFVSSPGKTLDEG